MGASNCFVHDNCLQVLLGAIMSTRHFMGEDHRAFPNAETNKCFVMQFDAHGDPVLTSSMWDAQEQPPPPRHAQEGWMQRESNFGLSYNHFFPNFMTPAANTSHYWQPLPGHHELRDQQASNLYSGGKVQGCQMMQQQKQKQPRRAKELNALSSSFELKKYPVGNAEQLPAAAEDRIAEEQRLSGRSTPTRREDRPCTSPVTDIANMMDSTLGAAFNSASFPDSAGCAAALSAAAPAFVPAFGCSFNCDDACERVTTPTRPAFSSQHFVTPTHKTQQHADFTSQHECEQQSPTLKILHNQFMEEYVTRSPHADPAAPWLTYECDSVRQAMQQFVGAEGEIAEARLAEGVGKQEQVQQGKTKEIFKRMRALERQGLHAVQQFCSQSMHLLPGLEIKMMGEVADFAKRIGCVEEARDMFRQMRGVQPGSQHAWLESAKMEEELGCVEECEELLLQGLVHCPQSDSILLKAVKLQEKLGNMRMARSLLSRMKLIPVERAWRVILEGALLETRAGNMTVARKVFKYLVKSVPWYGPIYCDMCAVHERECDWLRAEKIVACGLQNIPRYGPLWLCAMRVCERKFMLPAFGKPLPDAAQLVCNQTRQIATQALQLMGSKELVWKLLMHASQSEARAGNVSSWRSATTSASLSAPDNLRWKVWNAAAKMELACGDAALCLPLLERALQVKHATHLHF